MPHELAMLTNIDAEFMAYSQSAMDLSVDILVGRPYGGTAILFKKSLSSCITPTCTNDPRLTVITMKSDIGPILFVCVYMPTDYGDTECYENYIEICAKVTAVFEESDAIHLVVCGDFNCQVESRFYNIFTEFATDNNLVMTDLNRMNNVFTYYSDDNTKFSWIDHALCTSEIDKLVLTCNVLCDFISSDHKPLTVTFNNLNAVSLNTDVKSVVHDSTSPDWSQVDQLSLWQYQNELDIQLKSINIPALYDYMECDYDCLNSNAAVIDSYYNEICNCINSASTKTIPLRVHKSNFHEYVIPGWNDYVCDKHAAARSAFVDWIYCGRPRDGYNYEVMRKTRAQFKLALRYCKQHNDMLCADNFASSLLSKDYSKFWQDIRKANNKKATNHTQVLDGSVGENDICARWQKHFESLYNKNNDVVSRHMFYNELTMHGKECNNNEEFLFTFHDVANAATRLKMGKATGQDGISAEAIKYACPRLYVHICILFNMFLKCGNIPDRFMQSVIVPLLKNKTGNITDVNNYRAIAISNSLSKLFETVMFKSLETSSEADKFQFGFKPGHSTGLCTNILKQTIDYYRERGSHVFVCFVDFSQAFDNVNYWKLFHKLLEDNVSYLTVRILAYWYSNQVCFVRWRNCLSGGFHMCNGTRQGGVLSPYLFSRYIRDLIAAVVNSGIGCKLGNQLLNILAYADDLVLLAPSWNALQNLLELLHVHAGLIDMIVNVN